MNGNELSKKDLLKLLRNGKSAEFSDYHSEFRLRHPGGHLDLANSKFENVRLYLFDLAGADLSGLKGKNVQFSESNLDGVMLDRAVLTDCSFSGCSMVGASLRNAELGCCGFTVVHLTGVPLNEIGGLATCHFVHSTMTKRQLDVYFATVAEQNNITGY